MPYLVQLEDVFEGPFDLLLDLIKKDKVDIWHVSLSTITQQYLDYIRQVQDNPDLAVSGDFMVMAAMLLEMKAHRLLPAPAQSSSSGESDSAEEIDPEQELIRRLQMYKMFKEIAAYLEQRNELALKRFTRAQDENQGENRQPLFAYPVGQATPQELARAFDQVAAAHKGQAGRDAVGEQTPVHEVRQLISLTDTIHTVRRQLRRREFMTFGELVGDHTGQNLVVTFLAVLELVRISEIAVYQEHSFGEIHLQRTADVQGKDGDNNDVRGRAAND